MMKTTAHAIKMLLHLLLLPAFPVLPLLLVPHLALPLLAVICLPILFEIGLVTIPLGRALRPCAHCLQLLIEKQFAHHLKKLDKISIIVIRITPLPLGALPIIGLKTVSTRARCTPFERKTESRRI